MNSTPTSQHVHTGLRQSLECGPDIALRWHDCALIQQQPVWEHFTGESQEVEDLGGASKCCQQKPTQQLATVGQRVTVSKNAAQMSVDCLRELEAKTQRLIRTQHRRDRGDSCERQITHLHQRGVQRLHRAPAPGISDLLVCLHRLGCVFNPILKSSIVTQPDRDAMK